MRLEKFITERTAPTDIMAREDDPDLDKMLTLIEKDCKHFLAESKTLIYRGTKQSVYTIEKHKARTNRRPTDMPLLIHNTLDEIFKKKFGWKARSAGVFVATGANLASDFGTVSCFFPIGKYEYIWSSKISDLYITLSTGDFRQALKSYDNSSTHMTDEDISWLTEIIDDNYTGESINVSNKKVTSFEAMFHCPHGYYLASGWSAGELSHYLGLRR